MSGVIAQFRMRVLHCWRSWTADNKSAYVLVHTARSLVLPVLLALQLSACAMEGDFGRPQPTFFKKFTDHYLASDTTLLGSRGGSGVTPDEVAMRDAGMRLASPVNLAGPTSASYGWKDSGYGTGRLGPNPEMRLRTIDEQLDIDQRALTDFGVASRSVLITDSRRMQAVYDHNPYLLEQDRQSARARMRENYDYVMSVLQDFAKRLQTYGHALRGIEDEARNLVVADVRNSLYHLRDRAASLEYELRNLHGVTLARGDYRPPREPRRWDAGYASRRNPPPDGSFEEFPSDGNAGFGDSYK